MPFEDSDGGAGHEDVAPGIEGDAEVPAAEMDRHVASGEAFGDGGHSCGARAGAAGHGFAAAPFPYAHLYLILADNMGELYVGSVGETFMSLGHGSFDEYFFIGRGILREAYEMRISHGDDTSFEQ